MTALAPTLSTRYFPQVNSLLRDALLVLAGSWLMALFAQLEIPLQPVPITGQTFAVLLVGALLGSRRGMAAMLAYLIQGGLGLPFFAGGASGLSALSGATAGYLVGFVLAAYAIGLLAERGLERDFKTSIIPFLIGTLVIYICGLTWLAIVLHSFAQAIQFGLMPFLFGDALKLLAAAVTLPAVWRLLKP